MAPTDKFRLPFRWQFVPIEDSRDRSIRWTWRAYTHAGALVMNSERLFDSLRECIADAKAQGYDD